MNLYLHKQDPNERTGRTADCQCSCHRPDVRGDLLAACERILAGNLADQVHRDCRTVAVALKQMLTREWD